MVSCHGAELSCGGGGEAARTPVACEKLLRLVVPRETLRLRVRLLAELAPGSRRDPQRRCADSGDPRHRLQLQGRRTGEHEKRQEDARKSHAISSGKALGSAVLTGVFQRACCYLDMLRGYPKFITPTRQEPAQLPCGLFVVTKMLSRRRVAALLLVLAPSGAYLLSPQRAPQRALLSSTALRHSAVAACTDSESVADTLEDLNWCATQGSNLGLTGCTRPEREVAELFARANRSELGSCLGQAADQAEQSGGRRGL